VLTVGLAVAFGLGAAACGGDDGAAAGAGGATTSSSGGATTTTAAPTTATTPAPTVPTTVAQVPQPSGPAAVDALLAAWRAGDRTAALTVADPAPVDTLFGIAPETGQARGCNSGAVNPTITCVFRLQAGELSVRATPRGGGFVVDFVILGSG
jgi:hypothetical protein